MGRRVEDEGVSPRARARLAGRPGWARDAAAPERSGSVEYVARPEDLVADVRRLAVPGGDAGRPADAAAPGGGGPVGGGTLGRHRRVRSPRQRWVRLPASFVGARWQPGRSAVVGVLAVALLAVLLVGARVVWARPGAEPVVVAPGGGSRAGPTGVSAGVATVGLSEVPSPSVSPAALPSGATAEVVVHVVGEVREPGVQRLPAGARVSDAVAAAGGATRRADVGAVNLARPLVDGEQVRVPAPGEAPPATGAPAAGVPGGAGAAAAPGTAPVSLNTGDLAALDTLPGVGPVLAQRIVDWRTTHGQFTSVDELTEVSGIGETMLARLRPLVTT
jgi:competence protein ComEA